MSNIKLLTVSVWSSFNIVVNAYGYHLLDWMSSLPGYSEYNHSILLRESNLDAMRTNLWEKGDCELILFSRFMNELITQD